jgi:hypothetical protein
MSTKKSVSYFFDEEIGLYHYANGHYMKPFRIAMTDELVRGYGLYNKMKIYVTDLRYLLMFLLGLQCLQDHRR